MSTQPHLTPQWKEEVNRRVAAHKNRRNGLASESHEEPANAGATRAAQAAARVAARYAKAPTYSQMQAAEARTAVRAAEIATQVALEAQAVAHNALAELHAASQSRGPAVVEDFAAAQRKFDHEAPAQPSAASAESFSPVEQAAPEMPYQQPFAVRWDPEIPSRSAERRAAPRAHEEFALAAEDWWSPAEIGNALRNEPLEVVSTDAAQANVLQFPRELIATRKIRPRLAENCGVMTEAEGQLSIFEVDPRVIMPEAATPVPSREPAAASPASPGWSGIKLDAHPVINRSSAAAASLRTIQHLAPFGLRMMATVIDCALILAGFVVVGFIAAGSFHHPPTGKPAELLGMLSLVAIGLLYYGVFFSMGMSTPGMKYAGIGLCTFEDQSPTRAQLQRRLGAMALSLLPVGLGVVWSVFDDDHLTWHDRISQTYLRKC